MELLALFIVKKRRTVAKKIPVVNSLLNEDEGSSEKKKIGRFQPIMLGYHRKRRNDCVSSPLSLQSWSGRILFACSKRTSSSFCTNSHRSNGFLPMLRELLR